APTQFGGALPSNSDAFLRGALETIGPAHAVEQRLRHAHAGHFVRHELSVSRALEREHAGDDRQAGVFDAFREALESAQIEDRTRHDEFSAGLDLVVETAELL